MWKSTPFVSHRDIEWNASIQSPSTALLHTHTHTYTHTHERLHTAKMMAPSHRGSNRRPRALRFAFVFRFFETTRSTRSRTLRRSISAISYGKTRKEKNSIIMAMMDGHRGGRNDRGRTSTAASDNKKKAKHSKKRWRISLSLSISLSFSLSLRGSPPPKTAVTTQVRHVCRRRVVIGVWRRMTRSTTRSLGRPRSASAFFCCYCCCCCCCCCCCFVS